jgi:predicted glycoside hydrolase/deacetylase ChbG (UPF0249 family)
MILCSDDFAMTKGISEAILSLAEVGRLSATSAMVTTIHWQGQAKSLIRLHNRMAVGLHFNLSFGSPLGPMPNLAPKGVLPTPNTLIARALADDIDHDEVEAELERQLDRFETAAGFPPDFLDGHHHAHILKGVRRIVIGVLKRRFPSGGVLLRDPSDTPSRIIARRGLTHKALCVNLLAFGFSKFAIANGFPVNVGFSGYSSFGRVPYSREFETFLACPGPRHMIMCHPGFIDNECGPRDTIANRRPEEYAVISTRAGLPDLVWHPNRDGPIWGNAA